MTLERQLLMNARCRENWANDDFLKAVGARLGDSSFVNSLVQEVKSVYDDPNELIKKCLSIMVEEQEIGLAIPTQLVSGIKEEEVKWFVPGYIPEGQITLLAGDGGAGKTSVWCNLMAMVTAGKKSLFNAALDIPFDDDLPARDAMFFSSEDSVPKVLKNRFRKAGADETRLRFIDLTSEAFLKIKFNAPELEALIKAYRPALCVFDPLQSFVPAEIQMGSRNAMRQCLSPVLGMGEKYGTTFLIIMHTNKKQNVWGRTRIADSADVWDIARSVLIAGTAENGVRYLSHEKNNYGKLEKTILFDVGEEGIKFLGTTDKRDKDFVTESSRARRSAPARDEAKQTIIDYLEGTGSLEVAVLDAEMDACGISRGTLKRAKDELKAEQRIKYFCTGYGKEKKWYIQLLRQEDTK